MRFLRPLRGITLIPVLLLPIVAVPVLLFAFQDKMIYHPRRYQETQLIEFRQKAGGEARRVQPLSYSTSQGPQQAYYVRPRSGQAAQTPQTVWVLFNGNGSLALEWMYLVAGYPAAGEAFLLVEYPGYGNCAGHPSAKHIQESADAALGALAAHLGVPRAALEPRLKVLGHSLGCAAALGFTTRHPKVSRVVLLAPFSSMQDMARRTVGTPLCHLLRDNYDNRACIREITARNPAPEVEILSGTEDGLIPPTMGRELAALSPKIQFHPVKGAGHNDILQETGLIYGAMRGK